ncbi:MAG: NADH-quinone oxidoreductase subunit J [Alphaproteobacteria bacterium]|nr:NADH-quinone oxidoreductase subunit J [Alphaproteobacteria bacterium]MBV8548323.1 NADH-quinone oxidoreductase subunit J [Alphaproteobacteria bacterium]
MTEIVFYLFATILILSAGMVVASRNPVHAVLYLVLAFFNAAGLFLLIGAEFVAFILVIVYVGAVAVLFLFVVMMLDINFVDLRSGFSRYLPIGGAVGAVLLAQLVMLGLAWKTDPQLLSVVQAAGADAVDNTRAIGRLLYTDYFYAFQVSGLVLLVAMIGAICLTLRHRKDVRRQNVDQQLSREIADVITVVKVESGKGVQL